VRGDLAGDCRSEVQAERARDDQLARRPAASWRGDLCTQEFSSAIASSGPIIHGSGARSALNKTPPTPQIASAFRTG